MPRTYRYHQQKTKDKVLALRLKGLSYNEISERTKVPTPTVGSWIQLWSKKNKDLRKIHVKAGPKAK